MQPQPIIQRTSARDSGALTHTSARQVVVIEDLNVAGMVKNRYLSRSISDAAMDELSGDPLQVHLARGRGPRGRPIRSELENLLG